MIGARVIAAFLERFSATPVSIAGERCLNARHKDAGCSKCTAACPVGAIVQPELIPELVPEECAGCGACVGACPVEAVVQEADPESALARTVATLPDGGLGLICPSNAYDDRTRMPVERVVRHSRCLAGLSADRLLALCARGERVLWLDDLPCGECRLGRALDSIHAAVAGCNDLVAAFGRPQTVLTARLAPSLLVATPSISPAISGDQPIMSRRELLRDATNATYRSAARIVAQELLEALSDSAAEDGEGTACEIGPARGRLILELVRMKRGRDAAADTDGLPFADVVIGADCSACGVCAKFCPTRALSMSAAGGSFALEFVAAACVDCGLCQLACPEGAIRYGERIRLAGLVTLQPATLARGPLTECPGCGCPVAERGGPADDPLCFACRPTGGSTGPLRDRVGLIADVSARVALGRAKDASQAS